MTTDTNTTPLTDKEVDQIAAAMDENLKESESLQNVSNLPSNNGVETTAEDEKEQGYEEKVNVTINPENGIAAPTAEQEEDFLGSMDFDDLIAQAEKNLTESDTTVEITEEDIKDQISKTGDIFKDMDLSQEDTITILKIVKRIQAGEKFNIFKSFPSVVQDRLNKYLQQSGIVGFSTQANTARNNLAEILMDEFIHNISLEKYTMDFNREMQALENKINAEFSKMYKDYSEERENYIKSIMEGEEDETKKEAIGSILDSINDGFALARLKEVAVKIRVRHYDLEKPNKVFDIIHHKYATSTYNIYSVNTAFEVLRRHAVDKIDVTDEEVLKFFIVLCKFCQNYQPTNPSEHAFMYYSLYNPVLLDVYKGEEYDKFADAYLQNVLDVIKEIRKREENKDAANQSKSKKVKK